jgi:hypothetical protein
LTATTYSERAASALAWAGGAIAEIEKDEIAVVAAPVDPAHQNHVLAVLLRTELAALVGALQST